MQCRARGTAHFARRGRVDREGIGLDLDSLRGHPKPAGLPPPEGAWRTPRAEPEERGVLRRPRRQRERRARDGRPRAAGRRAGTRDRDAEEHLGRLDHPRVGAGEDPRGREEDPQGPRLPARPAGTRGEAGARAGGDAVQGLDWGVRARWELAAVGLVHFGGRSAPSDARRGVVRGMFER